jgi:G3E family GTPase
LDSIITLVDAEHCNARVFESEVGRSQIIYGDIILLNKTDLVSTQRVKELEESLRGIKRNARIIHSVKGDVPLPLLMSVGLFESDRVATKADHDHGHHDHGHHDHDHGHAQHGHADHLDIEGYTSLSFSSDGPFSLRKFQNFLDNQLPESVFRAKGILWFNESEKRHIFHLAGKRFSIDDSDWDGERKNQLVLIGQEMDHSTLRGQLKACVAKDAGKGFS